MRLYFSKISYEASTNPHLRGLTDFGAQVEGLAPLACNLRAPSLLPEHRRGAEKGQKKTVMDATSWSIQFMFLLTMPSLRPTL